MLERGPRSSGPLRSRLQRSAQQEGELAGLHHHVHEVCLDRSKTERRTANSWSWPALQNAWGDVRITPTSGHRERVASAEKGHNRPHALQQPRSVPVPLQPPPR
jgi:hypothetical protein